MKMDDEPILIGFCQCGCGKPSGVYARTFASKAQIAGEPKRYLRGHGSRLKGNKPWAVDAVTGCWLWMAYVGTHGYGMVGSKNGEREQSAVAHRVVYEKFKGPIPDGMDLDHLCRVTACVNPDHLEPVTRLDNFLRGEHPSAESHLSGLCFKGHRFSHRQYFPATGKWKNRCKICANQKRVKDRTTCSRGHQLGEPLYNKKGKPFRRCEICYNRTIKDRGERAKKGD